MKKHYMAGRGTNRASHSKALKEGIETLKDELQLAFQWHRPSILLAVHNSKTGQLEAQKILEQEIIKTHKKVRHIKVGDQSPDVIGIMSNILNTDDTVFFVSGFESADGLFDGNVYKALNVRRELLVERLIRAVFWLTELEAANLPRLTPDFWAFRHRVVEFAPKRGKRNNPIPAGLFLWKDQISWADQNTQRNNLIDYQKILADIPNEESAITIRLETLLKLIHYSWLLNDPTQFSHYLNEASDLSENYTLPKLQAWILNAKAINLYEAGDKKNANLLFIQAMEHDPGNIALVMNTSIASHALGKNRDAIAIGKKATKANKNSPIPWRVLGYLYLSMGKMEDAISAMKQALVIDPVNIDTHYSLAVCYYKNGQLGNCADEILQTEKISSRQNVFQQAYASIMTGRINEVRIHIKQSLERGETTKQQILRDPNLQILLNREGSWFW
jgi:tetratricopeptide (TPR) repeat protein